MKSRREIIKRSVLFVVGTCFTALGIAFTKHGELGVSPISSVANVLSYKFDFLSMGTWLIIWNCVIILAQIAILGKKFRPVDLLQVPLSFLFGWCTDIGMWLVAPIPVNSYPARLAMVFIGILIIGFGISLSVIANVILNCGEALVKAISDKSGHVFGNVKIGFDVFCVSLSILMSCLFFDFRIVGTREGTVISALLTGMVVKFFNKRLRAPVTEMLEK